MRQPVRAIVILVLVVGLFAAGTAAAGIDLKRVILRPGHCITLAKVRVCAAKTRPKVRRVTTTRTVTITTTPTPQTAFSDGTYRVGTDIVAGTYKSTATSDNCYWERLSGFGGTLGEIIANYFGSSPTYVTIAPTDVGFRSSNCSGWSKVS
jgi:hypothetical protein